MPGKVASPGRRLARHYAGGVAIDLHTHSTASDGTEAPAVVVERAVEAGLTTVALTDHDTTPTTPTLSRTWLVRASAVTPGSTGWSP